VALGIRILKYTQLSLKFAAKPQERFRMRMNSDETFRHFSSFGRDPDLLREFLCSVLESLLRSCMRRLDEKRSHCEC
jgi:hypothetical protein